MNLLMGIESLLQQLRWALFRVCPVCAVRWRNGFWGQSRLARIGIFTVWGTTSFLSIHLLVLVITWMGWATRPSQQLHLMEIEVANLQAQHRQVSAVAVARQQQHVKSMQELHQLENQSFEVMRHWPNSAIRMPLLSQLQYLAAQHGLRVVLLKSTLTPPLSQALKPSLNLPDASAMGFERTTLRLQLTGTERATYTYWQTVNRLLPNGLWTQLSWKLAPDGLYLLEGQLQLWWEPQDADTDTGVEVRWPQAPQPAPSVSHQVKDMAHVFPNHPQAQMRVVGMGQWGAATLTSPPASASPSSITPTAWAMVKSGNQVLPVQVGQLLGLEKSKVTFTNAQGLWLAPAGSGAQHLVAWETLKP